MAALLFHAVLTGLGAWAAYALAIRPAVRGVVGWATHGGEPQRLSDARVVAKRQHVFGVGHHVSTDYLVTFEKADLTRLELEVPMAKFGLLAEGDQGRLLVQENRFLDFLGQVAPIRPGPIKRPGVDPAP